MPPEMIELRISLLALARPQYTPELPRIPRLFALEGEIGGGAWIQEKHEKPATSKRRFYVRLQAAVGRSEGSPRPGHETTNQLSGTLTTTSIRQPPPVPPTCGKLDTNARRQNAPIRNTLHENILRQSGSPKTRSADLGSEIRGFSHPTDHESPHPPTTILQPPAPSQIAENRNTK